MKINISDDFDLDKIIDSGQCFRNRRRAEGSWLFLSGGHVLEINKTGREEYQVSCPDREWKGFWEHYFDLSRNYSQIRALCLRQLQKAGWDDAAVRFLQKAIADGTGLRILRQDPFETLITFIISQRKNMPAIAQAVEKLSRQYGHMLQEGIYSFPHPQELGRASEQDLRALGLGYRAPYVKDAVEKVLSGELVLADMEKMDDDSLYQKLLEVKGVGKKVADCVCLFGFGRTGRAPVDVWISRAIDCCGGISPFPAFGPYAGIVQQYVFYSMTKCG